MRNVGVALRRPAGDITQGAGLALRHVAEDVGLVLSIIGVEPGERARVGAVGVADAAVALAVDIGQRLVGAGDAGCRARRRLQLRIDEAAEPIQIRIIILVGEALRAATDGIERVAGAGDAELRRRVVAARVPSSTAN